jgi:uncharacterized membrane protein
MNNSLHTISILANILSIIFALIGFLMVIMNWNIWKKTSMDIIKARVFLDKKFLQKIWLYVVGAGALITFRRLYRYMELTTDLNVNNTMEALFDISGFFTIFLLVLVAYEWYRLIQSHP